MSTKSESATSTAGNRPLPPCRGSLTDILISRPLITERASDLVVRRRQGEAVYRPNRQDKDESSPVIWHRGILMCLLRKCLMLAGLYRRGQRNALKLQLVEVDYVMETLPGALDGFRILQLSDLHLPRRFPQFAAKVAELLRGVEVDLCVLNGDYRWGYYGPVDHVPKQLTEILAGVKSRHGIVACLGNHDTIIMAEILEFAGIPVLFNEGIALEIGDAVLWVCGIDDPHIYKCDNLDDALRGAPEGAFILLLAHTPERIQEAAERGVSLYLAGHTHGGQIRLPLLGAISKNAKCSREQAMGLWRHEALYGYTSPGLGSTDLPVRFNCPPEATLITLRSAQKSC